MKTNKLSIIESNCDCLICSKMCRSPCNGTPSDMQKLIDHGFGDRLMFDDWPEESEISECIKPALKGHEGKRSPWEVSTFEGCTFWKDGKCELHDLDLKPTQGKLSHHSLNYIQNNEIADFIKRSWKNPLAEEVINNWKKLKVNFLIIR
jgi:hypothetical protein